MRLQWVAPREGAAECRMGIDAYGVPPGERLRDSLSYVLQPTALAVLAALALAHLATWLPLGFVVGLLAWAALLKYAFECLRLRAHGRTRAPRPSLHIEDGLGWAHLWLQVIAFALNVIAFVAFGAIAGGVVAMLLALALPAAVITLVLDENLPRALDPRAWIVVAQRIGPPYFVAAALQLAFNLAAPQAQALAVPGLPPALVVVAFMFLVHGVVLANFHLMGRLLNEFHDELGFEPDERVLPAAPDAGSADQGLLEQAATLARGGQSAAACDMLGRRVRARDAGEAVHAQYHRLLVQLDRREECLRHGREWIGLLLDQGKDRRVVEVARACLALDPAFEPTSPDDVARVAAKAGEAGATQVALALVAMFHRRHPRHRDVPRNGLLAARLMAERMGKDATARVLLDQLLRDYPDHPLTPEIGEYRRRLGQLATAARAGG